MRSWDQAGSCRHCGSHSSMASIIAPDHWCLFCTPSSLAIFPRSLGFKSGEFGGHNWCGINSGITFCNNSMVARAQLACHVSQGSVETLFGWGGKRLHNIAPNLLRKQCTKFRQNRPSFVGDVTKNILVSFFSGHSVHTYIHTYK